MYTTQICSLLASLIILMSSISCAGFGIVNRRKRKLLTYTLECWKENNLDQLLPGILCPYLPNKRVR